MNSPYVKSYNLINTYHVITIKIMFNGSFPLGSICLQIEKPCFLNCLIKIGCQMKKDYGMSTTIIIYVHNFLAKTF